MTSHALIVVDIQNDFLPGGSLAVAHGNEIVPLINQLVTLGFHKVIASKDWHPKKHCSFASAWNKDVGECVVIGGIEQALWPEHCIQDSHGAAFAPQLDISHFDYIVHKGVEVGIDSYSAFFDNKKMRSTGLHEFLQKEKITDLYFAGLATDYCVYYSVLDALELGYNVSVVIDACRGIADVTKHLQEMEKRGAKIVHTKEVIQWLTALKKSNKQ